MTRRRKCLFVVLGVLSAVAAVCIFPTSSRERPQTTVVVKPGKAGALVAVLTLTNETERDFTVSCLLQTLEGSTWCEADEQSLDVGRNSILAKGQTLQIEVDLPAVARMYRFRCGYMRYNSTFQRVLMKLWNLQLPDPVGKANRKAVDLLWPQPKLLVTVPFQTWQVARATPPAASLRGFAAEPRMPVRYSDEFRSYYPTRGRRFELDGFELEAPVVIWDLGHHRKITIVRTSGARPYDHQRGIITITGEGLDQPRFLSLMAFRHVRASWITDNLILLLIDVGHVAGVETIYDVEDDIFVYRQSLSYGGAGWAPTGPPIPPVPASQSPPTPNPVPTGTIPMVVDHTPEPPTVLPINSAPPVFLTKEAEGGMNYEIGVYVVQAGDNLTAIAHRHQTTVKKLRNLNPELTNDSIQVGQQLRIYEKPSR